MLKEEVVEIFANHESCFDEVFSTVEESGFIVSYSEEYSDWFFMQTYSGLHEESVKCISTPDGFRRIILGQGKSKLPIMFTKNKMGLMKMQKEDITSIATDALFMEHWSEDIMKTEDKKPEKVEVVVEESKFIKTCIAVTTITALAVGALIFYDRFR